MRIDPRKPNCVENRTKTMFLFAIWTTHLILMSNAKIVPLNEEPNELVFGLPIEKKSWFETQALAAALDENLGDIMVFDGGTWNSYTTCRSCGKSQNFRAICSSEAEYLNLCGECVGGSSEKDDDYGLDSCGICGGLERCGQMSCQDDIEEDFESSKNCSKVVGIRPKVIDMAGSSKGVVHLMGNVEKMKLQCGIYTGAIEAGAVAVSESEWGLMFEFELPKKEGRLDMQCNSSDGSVLTNSLLVVNSRKLQPLSSREETIEYGEESQIMLSVANMIAMADLLCFAKDEEGTIQYKAWSNDIQGNSLSSTVKCDRIWPKKAGKLKFGVAYSAEAIMEAKTVDIQVVSKDLNVLWATTSKNKLTLVFNQAIETYYDCKSIFKIISDEDAKCWSEGNKIRVKFKGSAKIKIGDTLEVKVASASTGKLETFFVKIDSNRVSESLSNLEIKGPDVVCINQKVTFDMEGSSVKWSLSIPNTSANDLSLTPGNRQRKNMMMWRSVRETMRMMKAEHPGNRLTVNTTLLTVGGEYLIKATVPDGRGKAVTITKNFKITAEDAAQPMIKGPSNPTWTNEALYELDDPPCGPKMSNLKYEWVVGTEKEPMIQHTGTKIHLKPGLLSSNTKYNVSVKLMNDSQVISEAAMEVLAQPATLKAASFLDEIVFGTGHKIVLLGNSEILPTKSVGVKYWWSCESDTGPCLMPGKERKSIETLGGFDSGVLVLPSGSLPVGKYIFTLNVSLSSGESTTKTTRVIIVPGEPTVLSLVSVDFEDNMKIILQAKDVIGDCEINLESLKSINTTYLDLSEMITTDKLKGSPANPQSKTFLLDVPHDKLVFGTSYKFRFTGDCGALSQSWIIFTIPVAEKSAGCELNVTPTSGTALSTEFTFQVGDCFPTNPIYSYGYIRGDKVYYLISTLDSEKKLLSLPGNLKPVVKLCEPDKMCAVYVAENITVDTAPIDMDVARSVLVVMADDLKSGHFEEALGSTALLLESSKGEPDVSKNLSDAILKTVVDTIQEASAQIDETGQVSSHALDLLQCVLGVVKAADASDDVITAILNFRDKIEETARTAADVDLSTEVPSIRTKRSIVIAKRDTEEQKTLNKVESFLKTFETVIQRLKDPAKVKNETKNHLNKTSGYVLDLCNVIKQNDKAVHAESDVAEITAVKFKIDSKETWLNTTIPQCYDKCSNSSIQIAIAQPLLDQIKSPNGTCLGLNFLKDDFYSKTSNVSSESNITRWSELYQTMLFKYFGDKATNFTFNDTHGYHATIRIPIENTNYPNNTQLKCHMWKDDLGWNFNPCDGHKLASFNKMQAMECRCPFPGVYAVFAVLKSDPAKIVPLPPTKTELTTVSPLTKAPPTAATTPTTLPTTPSTKVPAKPTTAAPAATPNKTDAPTQPQPTTAAPTTAASTAAPLATIQTTTPTPTLTPENYKVAASFMINEKFNETVGVKKNEFENIIKTQLIKSVQIPEQAKVDAVNSNEYVKVVVNMRYAEKTDMSKLQKLLNSGELKLRGLNNTELKVPKQHLELVLSQKDGRSSTFAVVSTAIFISLAFILAILLSGMFLKWKRQQRALSFVQNMEISAPKYLRLQETSSFERIERGYGSTENLRSGELDSGIVLTVDPSRMSTKYHTGNSSSSVA